MDGAVGEADGAALRVTFDHRPKLEFHGSKVTFDAGLLPFRDLDDALGLMGDPSPFPEKMTKTTFRPVARLASRPQILSPRQRLGIGVSWGILVRNLPNTRERASPQRARRPGSPLPKQHRKCLRGHLIRVELSSLLTKSLLRNRPTT